jgi:hypothetical protein
MHFRKELHTYMDKLQMFDSVIATSWKVAGSSPNEVAFFQFT